MPQKSKRDKLTIGYDQEAVSRVYGLRNERNERSMTIKDLALRSGVSTSSIHDYEKGRRKPTVEAFNKLAQILGWKRLPTPKNTKKKQPEKDYEATPIDYSDAPKLPKAPNFEFTQGICYRIFSGEDYRHSASSASWDNSCIFRYEGKIGIHHSFREIRGGWTRTYTDAQLIGKNIQELHDDEYTQQTP